MTPAFLKHYQHQRKLGPDYHRFRKPVYQLYSLLNNVHLFGEKYAKPLLAAADEISRLLDLPLKVTGDSVEGGPEVCRALEELERYKQMIKAAA